MFEEQTEEAILKRMMDKVSNDVDKREGSILHNALAPFALELAYSYSKLSNFLEFTFSNLNTPEEYIEKRASEIGVIRKQATKAIKKALFYDASNKLLDIPIGTRLSIDELRFKAISKIDTGIFKMECESAGRIGNNPSGSLLPIDYVAGLSKAELGEVLEEGQDIEPIEDLYNRFLEKNRSPVTSGNPNHYRQWALEVNGVGKVKVFPLWNGEGTVKVVIVDLNRKSPSQSLINDVYKHIEEVRPIGAKVTVKGAAEKPINVNAKLILANGFNVSMIQNEFIKTFEEYIKNAAFDVSYISIAKVGNILLNTSGVLDYTELKLNNTINNITLGDEEIPTVGCIELEVS